MPDETERTTVRETPDSREEIRETAPTTVRSSPAGWWIAAVVAIIAVVGLVFLFTSQNRQDELQAARDQGAAEASLAAASSDAQRSASQARQAAQSAMDSTARASQRAAEAAQAAADQTARGAEQAARDASTTEPAPQSPPQQ